MARSKLIDFIGPSQAATQLPKHNFSQNLSDNIFNLMTEKVSTCEYFNMNIKPLKMNKTSSLILLHVNIRLLNKNFNLFHEFLVSLKYTPDLICLTETRLKEQPLINVSIPNYNFYHVNSSTAAGDVAVYVLNKLKVKPFTTQIKLPISECLWLEISEPKSKVNFFIGTLYRHPDSASIKDFLEKFSNILTKLSTKKKCIIF